MWTKEIVVQWNGLRPYESTQVALRSMVVISCMRTSCQSQRLGSLPLCHWFLLLGTSTVYVNLIFTKPNRNKVTDLGLDHSLSPVSFCPTFSRKSMCSDSVTRNYIVIQALGTAAPARAAEEDEAADAVSSLVKRDRALAAPSDGRRHVVGGRGRLAQERAWSRRWPAASSQPQCDRRTAWAER